MAKIVSRIIPLSELNPENQNAGLQIAHPIRILELANYQEGAIVSKTLSNRNTGTITLFAFDKEQRLSEHTSPFDAFVQILEGNVEFTVSGKRFKASEGEMVVLPANQPHALSAISKFKMLLIMIR